MTLCLSLVSLYKHKHMLKSGAPPDNLESCVSLILWFEQPNQILNISFFRSCYYLNSLQKVWVPFGLCALYSFIIFLVDTVTISQYSIRLCEYKYESCRKKKENLQYYLFLYKNSGTLQ